jgi:glycosyltransferase involved in cell wall biosynthesis
MIAFACNPEGLGEHWLGWGWAEQAAQFCDLTLLAWDRAARQIEARAPSLGIKPLLIGVPAWVNRIGDRSTLGRWFRQILWHRRANAIARQHHAQRPFDLVHQTTFHTFRIPFRAASWGIPSVWGPIAGGESTPPGFGPWLGNLRTAESARVLLNRLALAQPSVRRSLRAAKTIFVSNRTTLNFLPVHCHERCVIVAPNSLREEPAPPAPRPRQPGAPLMLLFVGNCVATRSLPLVFEAIKSKPQLNCRLTVVGGGVALEDWKARAATMNLSDRVAFTGGVPRVEVAKYYAAADAFVFPALRDSGGSGLLESMASGLPVVCADWGGPAEMLDDNSGIKVSVKSPEIAIKGFADAFQQFHDDPTRRAALGQGAYRRAASQFSWSAKRDLLQTTYTKLLSAR